MGDIAAGCGKGLCRVGVIMKNLQKILWGLTIFNIILAVWPLFGVKIMENVSMSENALKCFGNILFIGFTYDAYLVMPIGILLALAIIASMLYTIIKEHQFKINYIFLLVMQILSIAFGWYMFQSTISV